MESYRSHGSYPTELFFVKNSVVDWGILSKSLGQFLKRSLISYLVICQHVDLANYSLKRFGELMPKQRPVVTGSRWCCQDVPPLRHSLVQNAPRQTRAVCAVRGMFDRSARSHGLFQTCSLLRPCTINCPLCRFQPLKAALKAFTDGFRLVLGRISNALWLLLPKE